MAGVILAEGWEMKEMEDLPWDFGKIFNLKDAFYIRGNSFFSLSDGTDKVKKIKRVLIWGEGINILVIDTGENFYYTCSDIPSKIAKKIKNKESINLLVENIYNKSTNHYKGILSEFAD